MPYVIPASEFVGIGRRFIATEEDISVTYPCFDVDADTRHARICPGCRGAGDPTPAVSLYAIKPLGVLH